MFDIPILILKPSFHPFRIASTSQITISYYLLSSSLVSAIVNRTLHPTFLLLCFASLSFVFVLTPIYCSCDDRADISTIVLYHNFFVVFEVRIQVPSVFLTSCNVSCYDCLFSFSFSPQHIGESLTSRLPKVFACLTHVRMFLGTLNMRWYEYPHQPLMYTSS